MCTGGDLAAHETRVRHDFEPAVELRLEPVDSVRLTTVMDNAFDVFMPDQGPAHRAGLGARAGRPRGPASTMENGQVLEGLLAEHGFSMLVTVVKARQSHQLLFDAGTSPDGAVENMRRLEIDPASIEVLVCSHGHFDHTAGIDGLVRVLGRPNRPVLIHPHFWRRRRVTIAGREPLEIPSTSRNALRDAGFGIIKEQQPSSLLDGSVLITGELPRTTGYKPGFPPHPASLAGDCRPHELSLCHTSLPSNVT